MGGEKDVACAGGVEGGDDIAERQRLPADGPAEGLHGDRIGAIVQGLRQPPGAVGMGLRAGHARAELALGHEIAVGAVGVERRSG